MKKRITSATLALIILAGAGIIPVSADTQQATEITSVNIQQLNGENFEVKTWKGWTYVDSTCDNYWLSVDAIKIGKNEICLMGYTGKDTEVKTPTGIDGKKVTSIFMLEAPNVKKLTVSKSVNKFFGSYTMRPGDLNNLESLVFEDGIGKIKEVGFPFRTSYKKLRSITFPASMKMDEKYFPLGANNIFNWNYDYCICPSFEEDIDAWVSWNFPSSALVINCAKGSWGEKFAQTYNVAYKYTGKVSKKAVPTPAYKRNMTISKKAANIKWCKVAVADGYKLYQYKGGKWKVIKTLKGAKNVTFKVTGLKAGTTYKFKLKAYKKAGGKTYLSAASNTMKITTKK